MACGKNKSLLIVLGCLVPIIIVIALPLFGIKSVLFSWLTVFACPLTMFVMMQMSDHKKCDK